MAGMLRAVFDVRPDERRIAGLMCTYFFLVITSFWILKPIKKTLFIGYYAGTGFEAPGRVFSAPEAELLAKVLNMVVAAVAAAVFSVMAQRLRRQQLTYAFSAFFVVGYGVFAMLLREPSGAGVWSFYLFGDLFSTLMVATFFSFMNDSVSSNAAKRLYGVVGFGGVAGGAFGASTVAVWIQSLSLSAWFVIATALAAVIVIVARAAAAAIPLDVGPTETQPTSTGSDGTKANGGSAALSGARLVFRSNYLLSIVAIVGLYELVSTVVDFQFTNAILDYSHTEADRGQNFANFYAITTWLSIVVQLFMTSFVMRRFGLATALLILPCAIAMASTGFVLMPSLLLGGLLTVADNGFSYSINQSAKEVLYVPTSAEEKYQAKAFIDMFVQRFAKALGVGLSLVVGAYFKGPEAARTLSMLLLPVLGLWGYAALNAGRRFRALEGSSEENGSERDE